MIIRAKQNIQQGEGHLPKGTLGVLKQCHQRDVRYRPLSLEKAQQLIELLGDRAEEFLYIEDQTIERCYFDGAAFQSFYSGGTPGLLVMAIPADQLVGDYLITVDEAEISNQDRAVLNDVMASIEDFEALEDTTKKSNREQFCYRDLLGFGHLVAK